MLNPLSRKPNPSQHFELDLPDIEKNKHSEIAHLQPQTGEDAAIVVPPPKKPLLSTENVALISIILLLLSAGLGIWSWSRLGHLQKIRQTETRLHEAILDSLTEIKANLETNLDQLDIAFTGLRTKNDTLAERLALATNVIAEKENAIRDIKTKSVREESALREQVQRLQRIKDRYEAIIAVLDRKNAVLSAENARLKGTTDSLSAQISELGRQLESQIRRTISAQYKATAFRVELERRNDKLTVSARRTRELNVRFELNDVPAFYQGNQQLYLVITNDQGLPIDSKNAVQKTINTEKGSVAIISQATQSRYVIESQEIVFSYKLEDRLKKGTYVVSVYSDKGLLGVASFRLT